MKITERRIMPNQPGVGWYWEVIQESEIVLARGLAATRAEAETQAADAERTALQLLVSCK